MKKIIGVSLLIVIATLIYINFDNKSASNSPKSEEFGTLKIKIENDVNSILKKGETGYVNAKFNEKTKLLAVEIDDKNVSLYFNKYLTEIDLPLEWVVGSTVSTVYDEISESKTPDLVLEIYVDGKNLDEIYEEQERGWENSEEPG